MIRDDRYVGEAVAAWVFAILSCLVLVGAWKFGDWVAEWGARGLILLIVLWVFTR